MVELDHHCAASTERSKSFIVRNSEFYNLQMTKPCTIDSLDAEVRELIASVTGRQPMTAPVLRGIWRQRLRPFWRLHPELYVGLCNRLTTLGENFLAIDVATEGRLFFGDNPQLLFFEALAAARSGSGSRCREILLSRTDVVEQVADAPALLARTYKDAWKATGDPQFLDLSFEHYHRAYTAAKDPTFPGVNAAAMALLAGKTEKAHEIARIVLDLLDKQPSRDYWGTATRAESLLILSRVEEARESYRTACAGESIPRANLITTRAQARLLLRHQGQASIAFDDIFPLPNIACFSGHRIDAPGRGAPRFPGSAARPFAEKLRALLIERRVEIGFCSAANGGDILFAEALQSIPGGETHLFLASDHTWFREQSVTHPEDSSWNARFDAVLSKADSVVELDGASAEEDSVLFEFTNRVCIGSAMQRARELDCDLLSIVLWDGQPGQSGGTGDFVRMAMESGLPVVAMSPEGALRPVEVAPPHVSTEKVESTLHAVLSFDAADSFSPILAGLLGQSGAESLQQNGEEFILFFHRAKPAIDLARKILPQARSSIGLHYGPFMRTKHPLSGELGYSGWHTRRARELSALRGAKTIYVTAEFAAQARLERVAAQFEFLGRIELGSVGMERELFKLA